MKLQRHLTLATLIFLLSIQNAFAVVSWIDWTSTSTGTLDVNGTSVGVTLSGSTMDYVDGDFYYNNATTGGTAASGSYGGLMPNDLIRTRYASSFTLEFDQTIYDPYMALVSVGTPSYEVTYSFDDPFAVISSGANYWGYNGYTVSGNDFTGKEYNGVLQFSGGFDSITFDVLNSEYWHGFNFGVDKEHSVPAPMPLLLLIAGLVGLALIRKQQRAPLLVRA